MASTSITGKFALFLEKAQDRLGLAGPHQTVVDIDAGELIADGPMDDGRHHRTVDPAGQGADHLVAADLGPDCVNVLLDEGMHGPFRPAVADAEDEIAEDIGADQGMGHLRMELHGDKAVFPYDAGPHRGNCR